MAEVIKVPIGQVKRDISDLVNQVAYGGKRVVLTSRGKPKAALISIEDYERLEGEKERERIERWKAWSRAVKVFSDEVAAKREGKPVPVEEVLRALREETDERLQRRLGGH